MAGQSSAMAQSTSRAPRRSSRLFQQRLLQTQRLNGTTSSSGDVSRQQFMFVGKLPWKSRRETSVASAAHYFFDHDKHQFAGNVLREKRSREIAQRLNLSKNAWEASECLVCHAPAANSMIGHHDFKTLLADGVGCESCHGAARQWLASHHTYEWKFAEIWPKTEKERVGFRVTKDLVTRVNVCATVTSETRNNR